MRPLRILAAVCLSATALTAYAAGDAAAGRNKVYQCQGCHGIVGWKTAFPEVYHVPKLGGQNPAYIVAALKEYKSGDRDFATMRAIASTLSDQDMEDIAAYYGAGSRVATDSPRPASADKK
ncbi:MAG TPA: c-type cytochrome [Usitatibacter sp.]|nr:c-type cytochrome [Usitatibacter sp.]